jgi:hypothetical protein
VCGVDGTFKFSNTDRLMFQALRSETEYPAEIQEEYDQPAGDFGDHAFTIDYTHDAQNWLWGAIYNDIGEGFRADSGFLPRVGARMLDAMLQRRFWGDDNTWFSNMSIGGEFDYTEDQEGNLLSREIEIGWTFRGGLRSSAEIELEHVDEAYEGRLFPDQRGVRFNGRFWPTRNLTFRLEGSVGDQIDYTNTQPGEELRLAPGVTWRPGVHWELDLDHDYSRLDVEGGRLLTANLSQARIVYYLNLRTFVRAIVQYTDVERDPDLYQEAVQVRENRFFTQLLFSYKLNPRTVVFVGYSDTSDSNDQYNDVVMNRTVFIKLGYAWLL